MFRKLRAPLIAASALFVGLAVSYADVPTAEQDCRNRNAARCETAGVEFVVDGPCPAGARTLRPQGTDRCDVAPAQRPDTSISSDSSRGAATPAPVASRGDLARVGEVERWLLPALVLVGAALAFGVAAWAIRRFFRRRQSGDPGPGGGRSVIRFVVAATIAGFLAWQAAGVAFQRVFTSFDNHDTAAPWLLAAPVALVVFVAVLPVAFAACTWVLRVLGNASRAGQ